MVWMHDNLRTSPWSDLDRTFAQLLRGWPGLSSGPTQAGARVPAMNVGESPEAAFLSLEVPGVARDALDVTVRGNEVRVRGVWPATEPDQDEAARSFERAVRFREDVDADGLEARLANGILTVTVPKSQALRPRSIPIQVPESN